MILRLNPYIVLDGQVKEAVQFYEKVLDGEVVGILTFGAMPADPEFVLPEEAKDRVAHAMLRIGETDLMLSDTFPGQPVHQGDQVSICVTSSTAEKSKQIFDALAEGGQVSMPLQETSWSPAYGIVTDKYGVQFQITTEPAQA